MRDLKFDLNDIVLVPAESSDVWSRKDCNPMTDDAWLPLIAAPMDTVVCDKNINKYIDNSIIPCMPRGKYFNKNTTNRKMVFQSFGLNEIEKQLELVRDSDGVIRLDGERDPNHFTKYEYILIDIANGHMSKLVPLIKALKRYPIKVMIGNVANPETFANLALAGADYVRCSVGTGAGCTTAANVSINYPMGSLISECYEQKIRLGVQTKIVADGGMKNYSDIIKSLALGADYVMVGSLFNKAIGSSGFNYLYGIKLNYKIAKKLWLWGFPVKKKYRGMSTKAVQRSWGKSQLVTAEGITKYQKVEYTLEQWTENFKDYLRSAMSYCNAKKLDDFIGVAQYVFITENARKRFDK